MKKSRLIVWALTALTSIAGAGVAHADAEVAVVPLPVELSRQQGALTLSGAVAVSGPDSLVSTIVDRSDDFTDMDFKTVSSGGGRITVSADPELPAEGYSLTVTPQDIDIKAADCAGAFYAMQTLRQLYDPETHTIPAVEITDYPRFAYRGFMLDEGRHIFGIEQVKKVLDMMALNKLNRFHWHLTEDQGWRMEVPKYPQLAEVAAQRPSDRLGWKEQVADTIPYGGYYSDDEMREIVDYAAGLFIEIIPEIDIPGHTQAAVAAYPELLACDPENPHEVWTHMGVSDDVINVANPAAVQFAKDVIDHAIEIFPYGYLHLGGDECPTTKWEQNDACRALLDSIGSTDYRDLQLNFYRELQRHIDAKPAADRRRLIFWNEVLHGNTDMLDSDIVIMAWVGADKAAREAAERGFNTILTPQIPYYINRKQSSAPDEPHSQGQGTETLERVYSYVPMADISDSLASKYMGVQANFWSEFVSDADFLEYLMMPRLAAVAEAAWTPQSGRDYTDFTERLKGLLPLYDRMNWNYCIHFLGE